MTKDKALALAKKLLDTATSYKKLGNAKAAKAYSTKATELLARHKLQADDILIVLTGPFDDEFFDAFFDIVMQSVKQHSPHKKPKPKPKPKRTP